MKKGVKIIVFSVLATIVYSCSVKKDAFLNRSYHAVTTKYNVLFNGEQAYLKGLEEIQEKHEDNFWKRLQIEPISFDESKLTTKVLTPGTGFNADEEDENKNLTPFEKAEEKAIKAVQTHSMNIKGYERNSQIDDAYLLLGKSRYYTQRFIPALEAFNYVIVNYPKADLNYETKIWRAKTNIRLGNEKRAIETLSLLLDVLDEKEKINKSVKEQAYTAMAMAYEQTDTIQKMVDYLKLATKTHYNKEQSARNMFVLGQIYSELDRKDSARMVFRKLADHKRAPDRFRIRADIELAKNTPNDSTSILMLARLRKLIKNSDNRKFLNELYYQAGVIQEGRNNPEAAAEYYKKSLEELKDAVRQGKVAEQWLIENHSFTQAHLKYHDLVNSDREYVEVKAYSYGDIFSPFVTKDLIRYRDANWSKAKWYILFNCVDGVYYYKATRKIR